MSFDKYDLDELEDQLRGYIEDDNDNSVNGSYVMWSSIRKVLNECRDILTKEE